MFDTGALRLLTEVMGVDRVMLGSDSPFPLGEQRIGSLVRESPHLSDADRKRMLRGNAAALLRACPNSHGRYFRSKLVSSAPPPRRSPTMTGRQTRLLAASRCTAPPRCALAQAPIKIGFMAELSGPQGALGQDQYDAFMMVVERNGGKLGGVPVQVLKEDSQLKPEVAHADRRQADREGQGADHHRRHLLQRDDGGAQEDHRQGGVPDRLQRRPGADRRRAVLAVLRSSSSWQNDKQAEVVGKYATDKGYKRVIGMAPNYQAGKDFIAGFKRYYKGEVVDEIYTPLNQPDFSAELAQVARPRTRCGLRVLPGRPRRQLRAPVQAGRACSARSRCCRTSTTDGSTLPALKDDALGVISGTFWGPDFNNPVNKQVRRGLREEVQPHPVAVRGAVATTRRCCSTPRIAKVKGNVADKKAFHGRRCKAADFKIVRGNFKFNNNDFPIQDMHVFEVAKDAQGPREPEDDRHAAQGPPGRVPRAVHAEVAALRAQR